MGWIQNKLNAGTGWNHLVHRCFRYSNTLSGSSTVYQKSFERACSKLFINLVSVLQRIRTNGPVFRALFIIILHACLRRHLSRLQILRHFSPIAIPTSSLSLGGLYSFAICMVPAISASYKFSRTCLGY